MKLVSDTRFIIANLRTVKCYLVYPPRLRHSSPDSTLRQKSLQVPQDHVIIRLHFKSACLPSPFCTPVISWASSIRINTKVHNKLLLLLLQKCSRPIFGKHLVQISAAEMAVLTKILYSHSKQIPWWHLAGATNASFQILFDSSFINKPHIRRHKDMGACSVFKQLQV